MMMGCLETNLYIYILSLGGTKSLLGVSLLFTCLAEVPIFFFSDRMVNLLSVKGVICLAIFAMTLRMLGHYLIVHSPTLWVMPFIEVVCQKRGCFSL
jgi:hypothetical protein